MHNHLTETSEPNRTIDEFPTHDSDKPRNVSTQAESARELAVQETTASQPGTTNKELAHDLGYQSVRQMMEQTEVVPLPGGSYMYLTTDSDNYWVAWRDKPFYDIQRFDSRHQAISCLQECADWMMIES